MTMNEYRHGQNHQLDDLVLPPPASSTSTYSNFLSSSTQIRHDSGPGRSMRSPDPRSPASRKAWLDGLRGLAALLVYMHHQSAFFYGTDADFDRGFGSVDEEHDGQVVRYFASLPFIRLLYSGGSAMVAIFFVLSGYVLSRSFLLSMPQGALNQDRNSSSKIYPGLIGAAIRRPFRLYLPPIAVAYAYALSMHLPFGLAVRTSIPTPQANLVLELINCTVELVKFLNPFQEHSFYKAWFPYNIVLWTIPVELKGSILVYGVLTLLTYTYPTRVRRYHEALLWGLAVVLLVTYQWAMSLFVAGMTLSMQDVNREAHDTNTQTLPSTTSTIRTLDYRPQVHMMPPSPSTTTTTTSSGATITNKPHLPSPSPSPSPTPTRRKIYHFTKLVLGIYLLTQPTRVKDPLRSCSTPGWKTLTQTFTPQVYLDNEYWRFHQSIGATIVLHSLLHLPITTTTKLLANKTLLWLGKISFSLYLVHVPVLLVWADVVQRMLGVPPRNYKKAEFVTDGLLTGIIPDWGLVGLSTRFVVTLIMVLPVCFVLAVWCTAWCDLPSVKVSKVVSRRLGF